jgi:hypothetical protein
MQKNQKEPGYLQPWLKAAMKFGSSLLFVGNEYKFSEDLLE